MIPTFALGATTMLAPLACDGTPEDSGSAGSCGGTASTKDAAAGEPGTGGHNSSVGGAKGSGGTHVAGGAPATDGGADGPLEAGRPDATAPFIGWPPSTPTANTKCVPNCDAPACGSLCAATQTPVTTPDTNGNMKLVGLPCDTGCCASNSAVPWELPTQTTQRFSHGSGYTAVERDPSGAFYFATCDGEAGFPGECTQPGCGRDLLVEETTKLDQAVVQGGTFPDQATTSTGVGAQAYNPQFAIGKSAGKDALFVTYFVGGHSYFSPDAGGQTIIPPLKIRFGTKVGGAWTFETIERVLCDARLQTFFTIGDASGQLLAVDASGAPLVLLWDHVVRKSASGEWESLCLPGPTNGSGQAITADSSGAFYVARVDLGGNLRISRRDSAGNWWTEEVTGAFPLAHNDDPAVSPGVVALAAGGGTLHLAYVRPGVVNQLYYARRVGTTWEQHVVGSTDSVSSLALQLDACGSPHIAAYVSDYLSYGLAYYFRWTTAGWRGALLNGNGCDSGPTIAGGLAVTDTEAYMSFWTCYRSHPDPSFFGIGIPLR